MAEGLDYAGQFKLEEVIIIGSGGRHHDVTPEALEVVNYEDTQNWSLHGAIAINDNFDLLGLEFWKVTRRSG